MDSWIFNGQTVHCTVICRKQNHESFRVQDFKTTQPKPNQVKSSLPILFFPSQFPLTSRYCNSNISTSKVNPVMDMDQKDQSTCPLSISSMFGTQCKHNDIAAVSTALGNSILTLLI